MSDCIFSTFGTITKKEQLASVENETNSNALVLENRAPFPGYHGTTVPDHLEPDSLFAICKTLHSEEIILRAIQEVQKQLSFEFDAAPASLMMQNETRTAIRFKELKYVLVGQVIEEFAKQGIEFRKTKKITPFDVIIRVSKFFSLKQISEFIYSDGDDSRFNYIKIPALVKWDAFESMTFSCRNNCDDKNFDAAMASIYLNKSVTDFVRIYDTNANISKLENIKKKYFEAFDKL
jgi:hypothetical protein